MPPRSAQPDPDALRARLRANPYRPEGPLVAELAEACGLDAAARAAISADAAGLVAAVRKGGRPGLMESFLAAYGLDSAEGLALMSLAEALLRVPDAPTVDALIQDKVARADWRAHFGGSPSPLVNFSSWALSIASEVLGGTDGRHASALGSAVQRLGEPVIRQAVAQAMRILGSQFVFGRDIGEALERAAPDRKRGLTHSFDMLGEAARTAGDAARYHRAYAGAIAALAPHCRPREARTNPGISIKLSALHPRYEAPQRARVLAELVEPLGALARAARAADMPLAIDAEEADRLELSLEVIEAVLADPALAGWEGFGVVVQAYGRRAGDVIDWLEALAGRLDRRIMVRLVKGAYWDAEIKRAQVLGLEDYPVFTRKAATDVSYLANARKLLASRRIFPAFATHNAHTAAAVLHMAAALGRGPGDFEFQRLHGMGEALHRQVAERTGRGPRVYAPVGPHRDLLAYLVRRLLENGANGSFVHQLADPELPPERLAEDPIAKALAGRDGIAIPLPAAIFMPERANSRGLDLAAPAEMDPFERRRAPLRTRQWQAAPLLADGPAAGPARPVTNPADPADVVGTVIEADAATVSRAIGLARAAAPAWAATGVEARAAVLRTAAGLLEQKRDAILALLAREAGKTLPDAVAELREAVDFLTYYAAQALGHEPVAPLGVVAAISPWNFPLAIFTGQIAAALAMGNAVLAKPAPQTPLIAQLAAGTLIEAGLPAGALQLLPGGAETGAALTGDGRLDGVVFTGSLPTARRIERAMAANLPPDAPLIAETGGVNAMIVDSTALTEQAVRDILASAFQSAGQRCSALRLLYVQEEAAERTLTMLKGAMDELAIGDPWAASTDIGPVIDGEARRRILDHVAGLAARGRLIHRLEAPATGHFVGPAVIAVNGIEEIGGEVFGPVLHVARYRAGELGTVVEAINRSGYGLTFGLHTRISGRVEALAGAVHAGNIYVNRNQIGAVVGSQPFGGEGLSGTGPKAGGPHYLSRLGRGAQRAVPGRQAMPGPTGESNELRLLPRGTLLCLGPGPEDFAAQRRIAEATGNAAASGDAADRDRLVRGMDFAAVAWFGDAETGRAIRRALAERDGAILPLLTRPEEAGRLLVERHLCIDTTAAGGNASLMAAMGE